MYNKNCSFYSISRCLESCCILGVSDKRQSKGLDVVSRCERVADLLTAIQAL